MSREIIRCEWCKKEEIYIKYHDTEWGVPLYDDQKIFESLILEMFQSGLSWITVLKKRKGFRKSFNNFDYKKISKYSRKYLIKLENNSSIIRHAGKIEATKNNAIAFMQIQKEFGSFSKYIWAFVNNKSIQNKIISIDQLPKRSNLSDKISDDLKKRGFKFIGSTTIYSFIQSIGIVNDHTKNCFRYSQIINQLL